MILRYFVDILSLRMYTIKYPSYCFFDFATALTDGYWWKCGYENGNEKLMEPVPSKDPYIYFSALRFFLPSIYGYHRIYTFPISKFLESILKFL